MAVAAPEANLLVRAFDSDIWHSFRASRVTMAAALVTAILLLSAVFAPLLTPHISGRWLRQLGDRLPGVTAARRRRARAQAEAVIGGGSAPVRIVFACFGNICRSPFAAEAMRKSLAGATDDVAVASAGTMPAEDRISPEAAIAAARRFGVDLSAHRSRHLSAGMLQAASIIFVFDRSNELAIRAAHPAISAPILYLGDLGDGGSEISDPYGTDEDSFVRCYSTIERIVGRLASFAARRKSASEPAETGSR